MRSTKTSYNSFIFLHVLTALLLTVVQSQSSIEKDYQLQCWPKEQNVDKIDQVCADYMVEDINAKIHKFMCTDYGLGTRNLRSNNTSSRRELLTYQCQQLCMGWSPTYCGAIYPWCKRRSLELEEDFIVNAHHQHQVEEVSYPSSSYIIEVDSSTFNDNDQEHNYRQDHHRQLADKTCVDRIKELRSLLKGVELEYKNVEVAKINDDDYKNKDFNNDGKIDDSDKKLGEAMKKAKEEELKLEKEKLDNKKKCSQILVNIVCKCIFTFDGTSTVDNGSN